jgi:hypothetical protein
LDSFGDDHVFDMASTATQDLIQCGSSVRSCETYLPPRGRPSHLATTFSVFTGAIAGDDLDVWVATQPVGEHVGSAIVEEIDRSMRFQIEEQRAVAALLSVKGHIIDAQDPRAARVLSVGQDVQEPQKRVRAYRCASLARQPSTTLAANLKCERRHHVGGAVGATSVVPQDAIETFGEDFARAGRRITEPAAVCTRKRTA